MTERDNNPFIPIVSEVDGALVSNMCVWCGSKEKLTRSHLFADSLGGRLAPRISCEGCNSFLGHKIESLAKKNSFITAGMVKLGLQNKKDAYRHGKKIDELTQAEIHIGDDSKARAIPKKLGENGFIGSQDQRKTYFVDLSKFVGREPCAPDNC